jgi:hypothetical protein
MSGSWWLLTIIRTDIRPDKASAQTRDATEAFWTTEEYQERDCQEELTAYLARVTSGISCHGAMSMLTSQGEVEDARLEPTGISA